MQSNTVSVDIIMHCFSRITLQNKETTRLSTAVLVLMLKIDWVGSVKIFHFYRY